MPYDEAPSCHAHVIQLTASLRSLSHRNLTSCHQKEILGYLSQ